MTLRMTTLSPLLLVAVLAAGCGSSSSKSSSSSASTNAAGAAPYGAPSSSTSAASTASPGAATAKPITIKTKHDKKLGTILAAGPKNMTVYLWDADTGTSSNCSGKCAKVWPPVIGKPSASGKALSGDLGTSMRADGATQVTYKGHPLYYFEKDKDAGDAYGQGNKGFGAAWWVLSPSGKAIT